MDKCCATQNNRIDGFMAIIPGQNSIMPQAAVVGRCSESYWALNLFVFFLHGISKSCFKSCFKSLFLTPRGLAVVGILVSGLCIAPVAYAYFGAGGRLELQYFSLFITTVFFKKKFHNFSSFKFLPDFFLHSSLPCIRRPVPPAALHAAGAGEETIT